MRRTTPVQVGLFVLMGILVALLFLRSVVKPIWNRPYLVYVVFDDVKGLAVGTPVQIGGVDIGIVDNVGRGPGSVDLPVSALRSPDDRYKSFVALEIDRDQELFSNYRYTISTSLLGDQALVVETQDEKGKPWPNDDIHGNSFPADAAGNPVSLLSLEEPEKRIGYGSTPPSIDQVLKNATTVLQALAEMMPETQKALMDTLANLNTLTDESTYLVQGMNRNLEANEENLQQLTSSISQASADVARMVRSSRQPVQQMLTSSAQAAQSLERLMAANEQHLGEMIENLAGLTDETRRLVAANQDSVQKLATHAAGASERVEDILTVTQAEWPGVLSELRQTAGEVRELTANTRQDLEQMVGHLRGSTATLEDSLEQFQPRLEEILTAWSGTSEEIQSLTQATRRMWVEDGGSKDVGATITALKETMQQVQETTAVLRDLVQDPTLQEDLKGALAASRTTMEGASDFFESANQTLDKGLIGQVKGRPTFDAQWNPEQDRFRADLNLRLRWEQGSLALLGVENVGEAERFNLQTGRQVTSRHAVRMGLYRSELGVGWDAEWGRDLRSSLDLYAPNDLTLLWENRLRLAQRWWLLGGVEDLFDDSDVYIGLGFGGG